MDKYNTIEQTKIGNLNNWKLEARVLKSTVIKNKTKDGRDYQILEIDLIDKKNQQITGQFWGEAIKTHQRAIQESYVYLFSGGKYEKQKNAITFFKTSKILPLDENPEIPKTYDYDFIKIQDINANDTIIDTYGVIYDKELKDVQSQKGQDYQILNLRITNQSLKTLEIGIWGNKIQYYDECQVGDYLCIRNAQFQENKFGNRLSIKKDSFIDRQQMQVKEIQELKQWYDQQEQPLPVQNNNQQQQQQLPLSTPIEIENKLQNFITENNYQEKIYSQVECNIKSFYEKNIYYQVCAKCSETDQYAKKLQYNEETNEFKCEKCNQVVVDTLTKYNAFIIISDKNHPEQILKCSCFNDVVEEMLGVSAEEIKNLQEQKNEESDLKVKQFLDNQKNIDFTLKITSKIDTHQNTPILNHVISKIIKKDEQQIMKSSNSIKTSIRNLFNLFKQ